MYDLGCVVIEHCVVLECIAWFIPLYEPSRAAQSTAELKRTPPWTRTRSPARPSWRRRGASPRGRGRRRSRARTCACGSPRNRKRCWGINSQRPRSRRSTHTGWRRIGARAAVGRTEHVAPFRSTRSRPKPRLVFPRRRTRPHASGTHCGRVKLPRVAASADTSASRIAARLSRRIPNTKNLPKSGARSLSGPPALSVGATRPPFPGLITQFPLAALQTSLF